LPESPLLIAESFKEIPGMGISGKIDGHSVLMGSRSFIAGSEVAADTRLSSVYVSVNNTLKGRFTLENRYREGLNEVVSGFEGYSLHLVSGDNDAERENLTNIIGSGENLHFNQSPTDKLAYVRQLKENGKHVIMIGDGLNDAGALLSADVGVTIADDVYHFSPACDAILQSSKFGRLHEYLRFARSAMKIVYSGYGISFLYNVIGLSFAVQGLLSPVVAAILMPLSSITVVGFAGLSVRILARVKKLNA
jgi:Cu+-exporting ATPase